MSKAESYLTLVATAAAVFLFSDRMRGVVDVRAGQCVAIFALVTGIARLCSLRTETERVWNEYTDGAIRAAVVVTVCLAYGATTPPPIIMLAMIGTGLAFVGIDAAMVLLRRRWPNPR